MNLETAFLDAIKRYHMVAPGDRVLLAVSGGKDSFTLMELFGRLQAQHFPGTHFRVCTIQTDITCSGSIPFEEIELRARSYGFEYELMYYPISSESVGPVNCFYCSMRRRTALIKRAFESGYTKIALGHHLDDIVETMVMNMFHHGNLSTMPPRVDLFKGRIALVRPLAFVEETATRDYAQAVTVVPPHAPCPGLTGSNRKETKAFLARLESECPGAKANLFRTMAEHVVR